MRLRDTGTRLRGITVPGDYGNPDSLDWTSPAELELACEVQPESSDEQVVQQDQTVTTWRLFLAAGSDMTAKDRFRFNGDVYEVQGEMLRWRVRGTEHHLEARLLRVAGG